jgi:hypothetical protein
MSDYTLKLLFKDKVWPHKVNDPGKLDRAKKEFPGVELDIVFEKANRNFDVNHPPDRSTGLSLGTYFSKQETGSGIKYWLDFKNLDYDNDSLSLAILDSLTTLFQIPKNKVIVECGSPQYLNRFHKKGFKTAYYLPVTIPGANAKELDSITKMIAANINSYSPTYISFEYKEYPLLKEKFPNTKKIIWFSVYGSMNKMAARLLLYKLLMDDQVDILLIPFD